MKEPNGVNQGCVLATVLLTIYFSCLMKYAFENNQRGLSAQQTRWRSILREEIPSEIKNREL